MNGGEIRACDAASIEGDPTVVAGKHTTTVPRCSFEAGQVRVRCRFRVRG